MRVLIDAGADINASGFCDESTYLCTLAVFVNDTDEEDEEQIETLEMLIEGGADVNAKSKYGGRTPLIVAAVNAFPKIITMLVEAGADLEMKDNEGNTPLIVASNYLRKKNVSQLLRYGANVDSTNNEGRTALMNACYCSHKCKKLNPVARILLEAGADIDVVDKFGNTALIYAGQSGMWDAAFLMMKLSREHTDKECKRFLFRASRQ